MTKPLKTQDEVATERFNLIAPLVDEGVDKRQRSLLMGEIAANNNISRRSLRRYLKEWKDGGFNALKPKGGWARRDSGLGEGFDQVVTAAIELRRELPTRSVADIIRILEMEEAVEPGSVARSTLQRHLEAKGYGASQIRLYTKKGTAARRFQKEHRGELWISDIKYGPFIPSDSGQKKQIYLVVWIDDATRYVVSARFYADQKVSAIEDSLYRAIQKFGIPEKIYVDNGKQYTSGWLSETCAKLGIRLIKARPYHPEGKGAVERFNSTVNKFISEAALSKPDTVMEYNDLLRVWLDTYYHANGHAGLSGVSPATAFNTDKRPLKFVSAEQLRAAFLCKETRLVDKTGCVKFKGALYEVGLAHIARKVEVWFDPTWTDELEIHPKEGTPFMAKKLVIGSNCGAGRELPEYMRTKTPPTSRMLDALKKQRQSSSLGLEVATSFKSIWEGSQEDV